MSNTLTNTQLKAEILLLRGIPVFYSYLVPEELTAVLKTGMHVNIPLGRDRKSVV